MSAKPTLTARSKTGIDWALIEIPAEAGGGEGRLRCWLFGMRPAASAWKGDYTGSLESVGFVRGRSAPTLLYNAGWECRLVVHGDDFTFLCPRKVADQVVGTMRGWYDIKLQAVVGSGPRDETQVTILNRVLHVEPGQIMVEADPSHAKKIV